MGDVIANKEKKNFRCAAEITGHSGYCGPTAKVLLMEVMGTITKTSILRLPPYFIKFEQCL